MEYPDGLSPGEDAASSQFAGSCKICLRRVQVLDVLDGIPHSQHPVLVAFLREDRLPKPSLLTEHRERP